ncbi:MAG: GGDEF domain-containing protein [Candidatus Thiodiazotropha sp.]
MEKAGFKSETDKKILTERLGIARLYTYVGGGFSLLFAITSLRSGNTTHAVILILLVAMIAVNLRFLQAGSNPVRHIRILALAMGLLFIHLLISGGIHGSGILWFYIFPPLVYFLLGSRQGTVAILLLLGCSALILLLIDVPAYFDGFKPEFIQRLLASLTAITLLSYFYERSREMRYMEITRLSKELEVQAGTDQLSGLLNRFSMTEIIEHEMLRQERFNKPFSLIMGDIDFFKQINDSEGHLVGDNVIREIASKIEICIRKQDAAARWGGEEFLLFLPETDIQGASSAAHRIKEILHSLQTTGGNRITMSFGITESTAEDKDVDEIVKRCDENLYLAKEGGRDRVVA